MRTLAVLAMLAVVSSTASAQLNGTYTIGGTNPNYASIDLALTALNAGVTGPVTFLIRSGTYTPPTGGWVLRAITGMSSTNTVTFKPDASATVILSGNTGTTNQSGVFTITGGRHFIIDGSNATGGTSRNMWIIQQEVNYNPGVFIRDNSDSNTVKNCVIHTTASSGNTTYGIGCVYIGMGLTNDGNIVQNNTLGDSTGVRRGYAGVGIYNNSTTTYNSYNRVVGNDIVNFRYYGVYVDGYTQYNYIGGNQVRQTMPSGITVAYGIFHTEYYMSANSTIEGNKIYSLRPTPNTSAVVYGIIYQMQDRTSGTTNIRNNMISFTENGYISYYGMYIYSYFSAAASTSYTFNIYHNSVYSGGTNSSFAQTLSFYRYNYHTGGTLYSTVNHKNNIYYSTRGGGSTTSYGVYNYSSPAGGWISDNNLINLNVESNYYTAYHNFSLYLTLASYKTSGQDVNSVGTNPRFVDPNNGDLHISTSTRTAVEGRGTAIASVTTDIDGNARNATTPDIGADEGNFLAPLTADAAADRIATPILGGVIRSSTTFNPIGYIDNNGSSTQTIPVRVRILNSSNAVVYNDLQTYTVSAFTPQRIVFNANGNAGGSTSLSAGNYTIEMSTELSTDGDATNNTISGTLRVLDPLNGIYTIDRNGSGSRNFVSFTAAITDMNAVGINGPVTFEVANGRYDSTSEALPLRITNVVGATASNTVTFRPASGAVVTITGAQGSPLVDLSNADYVIFDGSNIAGGLRRDFKIMNTGNSPAMRIGDGTQYAIIRNMNLMASNTGTFGVLYLANSTTSTGNQYNQIKNNTLGDSTGTLRSFNNIYMNGDFSYRNQYNLVDSNDIINWGTVTNGGGYGIYLNQYNEHVKIFRNKFYMSAPNTSGSHYGIYVVNSYNGNDTIAYNRFWNLHSQTATSVQMAIWISTLGQATPMAIQGNMISLTGNSGNLYGLYVSSSSPSVVNVDHNTIALFGTATGTNYLSTTVRQAGSPTMNIRNNIIVNQRTFSPSGVGNYAIYRGSSTGTFYSNNNQVYTSGLGTAVGYNVGTTATDLTAWRAQGFDANSVTGAPRFIDTVNGNLHLSLVHPFAGEQMGAALGYTNDFDGQTRNATAPDIGADELVEGGVQLLTPNGGQVICSGATLPITWTSRGITNVKLEYTSNLTSFTTFAASVPATSYSYNWATPVSLPGASTYRIRISDAALPPSDTSDATFTVNNAPVVTQQPANVALCPGATATFNTVATAIPAATMQWQISTDGGQNYTNIPGATSASYSVPNVDPATMQGNRYRIVYTNLCGTATSNAAVLTVNIPPSVATQPLPTSACLGNPASFSVTGAGTGLTYQWRKNGVNIPGATSPTYTIASVQPSDATNYDVVISGTCPPAVTSNTVSLSLYTPPAITGQPQSQLSCRNNPVTFTVTATGSLLTYQWRRNGVPVPGANGATFTIPRVQPSDAGNYDVVVSGACQPSVTSATVSLGVNSEAQIYTWSEPQSVRSGSAVTFFVRANGTAPITYQWYKDGKAIPGATGTTYSIASVRPEDAGEYHAAAINICTVPSDMSGTMLLFVDQPTAIVTQPQGSTRCVGGSTTFSVVATGAGIRFQWKLNGSNIPGATASTYTIPSIGASDGGSYTVEVTDQYGTSVTSSAAVLTITPTTAVTTEPTGKTICDGTPLQISIAANGQNLSYQWYHDGQPVTGATSADLSVGAATSSTAGSYYAIVRGDCGVDTTATVTVTVDPATALAAQPVSDTVRKGDPVTFTVSATGVGLTYQWRKNGTNISGANTATYTISATALADSGSYDCIVTGGCGNPVTSDVAYLSVQDVSVVTGESDIAIAGGASLIAIPNPAYGMTRLQITLPNGVMLRNGASLVLYDLLGMRALDLSPALERGGLSAIEFDASVLPSGVYYVRMTTGSWSGTVGTIMVTR